MRTALLAILALACRAEHTMPYEKDTGAVDEGDKDGDGFTTEEGDCDDNDSTVNPAAAESCDNIDNDCDSLVDEDLGGTYYADKDGDGFGDEGSAVTACEPPDGSYIEDSSDCDDTRDDVYPSTDEVCDNVDNDCDGAIDEDDTTTYYADADGDGYGDPGAMVVTCKDIGAGYVINDTDCEDTSADVYPGHDEVCDTLDNDCDGVVDEEVTTTYYEDRDADGYGNDAVADEACAEPTGYAPLGGDCDDEDAAYNPGASESCTEAIDYNCDGSVAYADADGDGYAACEDCDDTAADVNDGAVESCNGIDDDCDGDIDDDDNDVDTSTGTTWYEDDDGDGYGDAADIEWACTQPPGTVADSSDCDDGDDDINPGATETCNSEDDDCDGLVDDDDDSLDASTTRTEYPDDDNDGYGDAAGALSGCDLPLGYVSDSSDCDDDNDAVNPSATEVCNDIDDDCDGDIDDADSSLDAGSADTWYLDADSDGYGETASSAVSCDVPPLYVAVSGDCDDGDSDYNPGAAEDCADPEDYNCDGSVSYADDDGDGYAACEDCDDGDDTVNAGARELCDGIDNDCDGAIDSGTGIFHDNFDDNDISDWSIVDGSWSVSSGIIAGYSSSHTGPDLVHSTGMDSSTDTYTVYMTGTGATGFGIVLGYASSSYHCGFHFWAGSTLYLVNSSTTETNVGSVSFSSGTYYDVMAEVSPGNVDLYFNGSLAYSGDAGCGNFTRTGEIGLQVHQSATAYFDEICVEY